MRSPPACSATRRTAHGRTRWLVRVIVSLLSSPADPDEERLVERFVVPAVLADLAEMP